MTSDQPRFSIIIPHYDGSISDELLLRGMHSLATQTFRDFEILLYHDGPLSRPLPNLDWAKPHLRQVVVSEQRHNDWGHSLRDRGIREARGEYIVHFNPDNILYPRALAQIDAAADAGIVEDLGYRVGQATGADVVDRYDRIRVAAGPAGVDDFLATPLHFRVVALHRCEVELLGAAARRNR